VNGYNSVGEAYALPVDPLLNVGPRPDDPRIAMIKVLFLAASSGDRTRQALDEDIHAIDARVHGAGQVNRLEFVSQRPARFEDLSGILRRERPQILHFRGHGDPAGQILSIANNGKPEPVSAEMLAQLLAELKDTVRVVVLDACYSESRATEMVKEVRWAVGMSPGIGEEAAVTFASEFYRGVAQGRSVQDAFDLGVDRLVGEGVAGAEGLVRLHKRPGVDPSESVLDEADLSENPDPSATAVADGSFPAIGTREWGLMNRRRAALIRKKNRQGLTIDENAEFERLQLLCFSALEQSTPGPLIDEDGLRRLRESL